MSSSVSTAGSTAPSSTFVFTAAFTTKLRELDRTGYRVWARRLQLYLEVKEVWEAVRKPPTVGQLSAEGSGTGDRPLHQHAVRQKLVMTIILAALTNEQAALVADLGHPQQMLMALQKPYRRVCDTTVRALKREYMLLYIDAGGDMLEHIRQTRLMLTDLACYKVSLADGVNKSRFLPSLGPDWGGYVGSLEASSTCEEMLIKAAGEARRRSTQAQRGKRGGDSMARSAAKHDGKKKSKCFQL
ncbi:gag-polypeptide of LTR copia-type [Phytophthora infestans]|uniref:Gag-polypeptide of LTR copia-type n=1 Tax=Phytophthora infestans TaxID=4787 RepID=A0A8S9UEP1_PHYIN|nr:gag-polypeptide of LTR copia-type [Phytophthora infestans]